VSRVTSLLLLQGPELLVTVLSTRAEPEAAGRCRRCAARRVRVCGGVDLRLAAVGAMVCEAIVTLKVLLRVVFFWYAFLTIELYPGGNAGRVSGLCACVRACVLFGCMPVGHRRGWTRRVHIACKSTAWGSARL
jgi:hypothetical protein